MKYGNSREIRERRKKLGMLLGRMRKGVVLVEGKRDKAAFEKLGFENVITVSGRIRGACEKLAGEERDVIIATDLDRRGNEMARELVDELERYSLRADGETRILLARILKMKYFEDVKRRYDEFMEEFEKTG